MKITTFLNILAGYACMLGLRSRPQEPKARPYRIETVGFEGGGRSVRLAGELTMPHGDGPFPAIILITGSGRQNRNEKVEGHKPFLILSDHLTRNGFAVLRSDDRGVGKSTGKFSQATPEDFAADAAAALDWLQHQPRILSSQIGFLGHSEGGYVAPLAARQVDAAFMIFLAGPAKPLLPDLLIDQYLDILRSRKKPEEEIAKVPRQVTESTEILRTAEDLKAAKKKFSAYLKTEGASWWQREVNLWLWATPWGMWYAAGQDPLPALKAFNGPVLALFGETDLQVSAKENAPIMASVLTHRNSEVCVLPGLNHLFQPSKSGKVEEYKKIKTTIDEDALCKIVDWLNRSILNPAPAPEQVPGTN